jgi:hypothetical protein
MEINRLTLTERMALHRLNDANTQVSVADRVAILKLVERLVPAETPLQTVDNSTD